MNLIVIGKNNIIYVLLINETRCLNLIKEPNILLYLNFTFSFLFFFFWLRSDAMEAELDIIAHTLCKLIDIRI